MTGECSIVMTAGKTTSPYKWFCILLLMCTYHQGINSTICTDKADSDGFTNVITMCRSGTMTAGRVVVDTYDTGDHELCQCTVRLGGTNTGPVNLELNAYPGTAPASECGSKLSFSRYPENTYTEYQCQRIGDVINDLANNELLRITLSREFSNIQWQSGYCIIVQSGTFVNINVTCKVASGSTPPTATTSITTTTTSTAAVSSSVTVTTPTDVQTVTNRTGSGGNGADDTVTKPAIGIEVIAGAAGGGAVLVIFIILVIVVIIRKKGSAAKKTEENFSVDIQPYAVVTPKFYHNDVVDDTVTHNSLYVSAGPRDPDNNHIVTETGDMYAQIQKTTNNTPSETEHSNNTLEQSDNTPSGDVYAVVNKPKKNNIKDELQMDDNGQPSRYKNQDGLMYAELEATTSRPKSRPPVRPKPASVSDTVIYSEVNTGV